MLRPKNPKIAGGSDAQTVQGRGPSPAEDGVPAFDETYEWTAEVPRGKHLHVRFGVVYERDPQ
jgi:hypothetical protein